VGATLPTEDRYAQTLPAARFRRRRVAWLTSLVLATTLTTFGTLKYAEPSAGSAADGARDSSSGVVQILHLRRAGTASDVWVYRPPVRDSRRLPVVYFLHGLPGQPGDVFHFAHLAAAVDNYIAHGGTPLVIAAPDGNSPLHADSEWGDASDGPDRVESFILNRVIPAVEGAHRRDPFHRAIAGFSMGGFGAMNIGLRNPGVFGQIVSIAGYFHLDDPSHMFATPASQLANDPDLNVQRARGHHILLADGLQDGLRLTQHQSQQFKALLHSAGISATLITGRGTHSWEYVESKLPAVLRFLGSGWPANTVH
jgi:S-formylglutathione hydrolase FrmB